eukprot:5378022-Pleurochrysis_carterae.AAC.1
MSGRWSKGRTTVQLFVNTVMRYATGNVKHKYVGLTVSSYALLTFWCIWPRISVPFAPNTSQTP